MAGTSTGTAIQTRKYVIANGYNPVALTNGSGPSVYDNTERELVYKEGVCDGCDDLLYNRFKGVGNFKYGIADTHFSDRERTLRLLRLLADTGRKFGFGVDTATSLSLKNGIMTVVGQDGVTVLNLTRARVDKRSKYFGAKGVRISYIRPGDTYDAKRRRFHLGGSPIEEVDTEEPDPDDRDRDIDRPLEFGVLLALRDAERQRQRGRDDDQLPSPEVKPPEQVGIHAALA